VHGKDGPEEELAVQVGDVDGVHVDHMDVLEAEQGEVLQDLAAQSTGTNDENLARVAEERLDLRNKSQSFAWYFEANGPFDQAGSCLGPSMAQLGPTPYPRGTSRTASALSGQKAKVLLRTLEPLYTQPVSAICLLARPQTSQKTP
jgi:hypothetical protein